MPNEPVDGILRSITRITTFGIAAKEVIDAHSKIMDEWEKFLDKQVKKPCRNRENLK